MSGTEAPIGPNDAIKVTKIETFVLKKFLGLRQDLDGRGHHRLGRDAQGRRQGLCCRRTRSR